MTERYRAVFDTNVFVSAALSKNPTSPMRELLERWELEEFALLTCDALATELIEKLVAHRIDPKRIATLVATLRLLAEWIIVPSERIDAVLPDADDDVVLACALLGSAHFIVTYDPHFDGLGGIFRGIQIVKALPFLWKIRGDLPSDEAEGSD